MQYTNGFIIVGPPCRYGTAVYHGIETDAFPLDTQEWLASLPEDVRDEARQALYPSDDMALLREMPAASYAKACRSAGVDARVLYLEVLNATARHDTALAQRYVRSDAFLGYDVGECAGDFYSILLNDVLLRPDLLGGNYAARLNGNGLFATERDARDMWTARTRMRSCLASDDMTFEPIAGAIIAVYDATALASFSTK